MQKSTRLIPGTLGIAVLAVPFLALVVTAMLWRSAARSRQMEAETKFLASVRKTPAWAAQAKAFELHKKTAAAIFAGATRVQVFRVASNGTEKPLGTLAQIQKFQRAMPYYGLGQDQPPAFAARLGAIILDPRTYPLPGQSMKACLMEPAVDVRVWKDAKFIDVLICFRCNQMAVLEYTPSVPMTDINGMMEACSYVGGDIDAVRPQLLALAKEAMPKDPFMQKLE